MWNDHILMMAGDLLIWCLRCGKWAHRLVRHLRSQWCSGQPTRYTVPRYRALCQGRHPLPPHGYIGEVKPLALEDWPRWCTGADKEKALVMQARAVAPLVEEEGLAVLEIDSSDTESGEEEEWTVPD